MNSSNSQAGNKQHAQTHGGFLLPMIKRFKKDENGATAVEFSLVAMPFFMLVFAIIETCLAFFAGQALETAIDIASRKIRTGQTTTSTHTAIDFKNEICNTGLSLFNCANLKVDVKTYAEFADIPTQTPKDQSGNLDTSGLGYSPGGSGEITVVRAYYEWPVALDYLWANTGSMSNGKRLIAATSAFRNEPFGG